MHKELYSSGPKININDGARKRVREREDLRVFRVVVFSFRAGSTDFTG